MEKQFKDTEESFEELKKKFRQGVISREEFIDQLKNLRLEDDEGRFWMIGAQSGKWYYLDGKNWIRSDPPSFEEGKAICIYCGFENKLTDNVCARCGENLIREEEDLCPKCGFKLEDPSKPCPSCNQELGKMDEERLDERGKRPSFAFQSISPLSFLFFWGIIGLLIGVILGAFTGASEYFSSLVKVMPRFLQEFQGKLFGGFLFAGFGGVAGFLFFGVLGFLGALFINLIFSIIGGIKIHLDRM